MRRTLVLVLVLSALALAGEAAAAEVVVQDNEGRSITFDVRVEGIDVEWYAALLRAAPHGNEISTLRVDVVSRDELLSTCGRNAAGCYGRNVIVVSAEQSDANAHTLVHEYGHHLDRSSAVEGIAEPNGTTTWWRARGMAALVRIGSVARSYVIGWNRSIAEIFAEDYAQLALPGSPFAIGWLERPNETVLASITGDLGLGPIPEIATPPVPVLKPLTRALKGSLAPKQRSSIPFGLLGPGRHVVATATITGPREQRARATLEIRCDGERVARKTIGTGKTSATIDRDNLGPGDCTATLTSTSTSKRRFTLNVKATIDLGG